MCQSRLQILLSAEAAAALAAAAIASADDGSARTPLAALAAQS